MTEHITRLDSGLTVAIWSRPGSHTLDATGTKSLSSSPASLARSNGASLAAPWRIGSSVSSGTGDALTPHVDGNAFELRVARSNMRRGKIPAGGSLRTRDESTRSAVMVIAESCSANCSMRA